MSLTLILSALTPLDYVALAYLFLGWAAVGWLIEHPPRGWTSVTVMVAEHRRAWMVEFVKRDGRIVDATLVASLRQGTAHFASTTLIAVGAVLALIGNTAPLEQVTEGLLGRHGASVEWQLRLLPVALLLAHSFLKFVWSNRVFGYCSVLMGGVPADPDDPRALPMAAKAAELNIRAALSFNRGLRSMYFALGALAWVLGPVALLITTSMVLWTLWRREFQSHAHDILSTPLPGPDLGPNLGPKDVSVENSVTTAKE